MDVESGFATCDREQDRARDETAGDLRDPVRQDFLGGKAFCGP